MPDSPCYCCSLCLRQQDHILNTACSHPEPLRVPFQAVCRPWLPADDVGKGVGKKIAVQVASPVCTRSTPPPK